MLICELAGGEITSSIVDHYPEPIADVQIHVKYRHIDRLIGTVIDRKEIKTILESLDIRVDQETEEGFQALVPPYRVDVTREADIIEEILRIHGFDSIPLEENYQSEYLAEHPEKDHNKLQYRISEVLAGMGYNEIITNSLSSAAYSAAADFLNPEEDVVILNKLSEDLDVLRQTLLYTGLEVLAHNINRRQKDLKLFEFGTVYFKKAKGYGEGKRLSLFLTGNSSKENWMHPVAEVGFPEIYAVVEAVLTKLNIPLPEVEMVEEDPYTYGLVLRTGQQEIGTIGLLKPAVAKQASVKQEVFYAELDWDRLVRMAKAQAKYRELSRFPEVRRDLSLVIDEQVSFEELRQIANKAGGSS